MNKLISPLAVLLFVSVTPGGVNSALGQQYYSQSTAGAYTQVVSHGVPAARPYSFAGRPVQPPGANRPIVTMASPPVATAVQGGQAYASPQVPSAPPSHHHPANSWAGAAMPYSAYGSHPVYSYGAACPECTNSDKGRCEWLCRAQKRLRGLYRASHRRSECEFEYPVSFPSGCPYGYVEPTWSRFCNDTAAPQVIGPSY